MMRGSLSGIGTKVERLAQRLRLSSAQDFAERVKHMTDKELEDRRQELQGRGIRLVEEVVGPLAAGDAPEDVGERFCQKVGSRISYDFVVAMARHRLASLTAPCAGHGWVGR
jgi:hypothetical protein